MPSGTRKQSGISHSDLGSEASDQNINKGSSTSVGGAGSQQQAARKLLRWYGNRELPDL
jgi:hypothetical protein